MSTAFSPPEQHENCSPPPTAPDPQLVARKVDQFFELCGLAEELALEGIKLRHLEAGRAELRRLLAERLAMFREGKWRRQCRTGSESDVEERNPNGGEIR
jgi:hypothetical protein